MWADLLPAAVSRLRATEFTLRLPASPTVQGFTSSTAADLGRDAEGGAFAEGWIFQGLDGEGNPYRAIVGSGKAAVVLVSRSGWASNGHNTAEFPQLTVLVYADCDRLPGGNPASRNAEDRAKRVWAQADRVLHDPLNVYPKVWGEGDPASPDLYVVRCERAGHPSVGDVPKGDGAVRLEARYNLTLG